MGRLRDHPPIDHHGFESPIIVKYASFAQLFTIMIDFLVKRDYNVNNHTYGTRSPHLEPDSRATRAVL